MLSVWRINKRTKKISLHSMSTVQQQSSNSFHHRSTHTHEWNCRRKFHTHWHKENRILTLQVKWKQIQASWYWIYQKVNPAFKKISKRVCTAIIKMKYSNLVIILLYAPTQASNEKNPGSKRRILSTTWSSIPVNQIERFPCHSCRY